MIPLEKLKTNAAATNHPPTTVSAASSFRFAAATATPERGQAADDRQRQEPRPLVAERVVQQAQSAGRPGERAAEPAAADGGATLLAGHPAEAVVVECEAEGAVVVVEPT